jgi:hypothetical protein
MKKTEINFPQTTHKVSYANWVPQSEMEIKNHRIALFVPSVNGDGEIAKSDRDNVLNHCRKTICNVCGGMTQWEATGYWYTNSDYVMERITILSAYFTGDIEKVIIIIIDLCRWMKSLLKQQQIAFEINSQLYLI